MNSLAAEGILLLGYDRDNTATVCLSEREYYHSVVYSREDTAIVCLSFCGFQQRGYATLLVTA